MMMYDYATDLVHTFYVVQIYSSDRKEIAKKTLTKPDKFKNGGSPRVPARSFLLFQYKLNNINNCGLHGAISCSRARFGGGRGVEENVGEGEVDLLTSSHLIYPTLLSRSMICI